MSESATLMYAELLSNIRQISVIAALENACNSATKAELSSDGQHFLLHHDGKVNTLVLPGVASASFRPQIPAPGTKELSWRLPLAGEPETPSVGSTDAPWPARDLNENTEFLCRGCEEVLVAKGHMREWKDLPSENWAEMMDFWHCHKPTIPKPSGPNGTGHSPEDPAVSRGYGANTKFTAQPNIGFVDLTTMLLAEVDCHGVEPMQSSSSEQSQYKIIVCKGCKTYIGHQDYQAEGYRIYKWRLKTPLPTSLQFSAPSYYEPSISSIITSQLQSIMLAQCSSRLLFVPISWNSSTPSPTSQHLPPSQFPPTFLNLWILNPSLRYSSTASPPPSRHGILAMKIFHRSPSETESAKLLDTEGVEEVSLPEETIREIARVLKKSGEELPPNGRVFREWEVGMLERFEG